MMPGFVNYGFLLQKGSFKYVDFGGFGSKIHKKYFRLLQFQKDFSIIVPLKGLVA
jgi:hypothetical protein